MLLKIFIIPKSTRPIDNPNINLSHLTPETRSETIKAVKILGPHYKWPNISKPKEIIISEADHFQMKVTVDGNVPHEIVMNNFLSFHEVT